MKKLLVIISMLAVAISCETMYGPVQTPMDADNVRGITISINSVADSTASFTLAPSGESSYYSYLVDQSTKAVALDSSLLLSVKYTSVAQGTVQWTAEAKSKTIELEGLEPNTTYQIYAVAASPMGFISPVVVSSFTTSDKYVPVLDLKKCEVADSVVTLVFNESVRLSSGAEITANYYAYNDPGFAEMKHVGTVSADMSKISINDNVVTVEFPGLPDGAYYAVNYPDGTFMDLSYNYAAKLQSAMILDLETWATAGIGVYGQRALGTFSFGDLEMTNLTEWETPLLFDFGSEYGYGYTLKAAAAVATFSHAGKVTEMTLQANSDFLYHEGAGCMVVFLPEEPARGDEVTITIAAESFEDLYGNLNEEWSTSMVYSYGYTIDDIVGTYQAYAMSAYQGMPDTTGDLIVEASNNPEKGNVMITSFLGMPAMAPVYANFDMVSGTLTIPSMQTFTVIKGYQVPLSPTEYLTVDATMCFAASTNTGGLDQKTPTVFRVPQPGVICDQSGLFGIVALFPYGGATQAMFHDIYGYFEAGRTSAPATSNVKPLSLPEGTTKGLELIVK